jgi:hypothetical protein
VTIRIDLEKDSVVNGDHLRGRVEWNSSGKEPRKIEVICRWRVAGSGRKMNELVALEMEENIASRSQIAIPFDFEIPLVGPLSYQGKMFSIIWEVFVSVDLPFAFDEEDTKTFTVLPRPYDKKEFDEEARSS